MLAKTAVLALAALASLSSVTAHSKALLVTGANGATTPGFANDPAACLGPERACQQDTIIFTKAKNRRGLRGLLARARGDPATAAAAGCGKTKGAGAVDCATELAKVEAAGELPSCGANGQVAITMHQLNGDGAGPFAMFVNTDGTGNTWTAMTVTTQVPGTRGRSNAKATDFPLVGQMPAGTTCTGGADGQTCLVQAQNPVGPFGGVVAVTQSTGAQTVAAAPAAGTAAKGTTAATGATAATGGQAVPVAAAAPVAATGATAATAAEAVPAAAVPVAATGATAVTGVTAAEVVPVAAAAPVALAPVAASIAPVAAASVAPAAASTLAATAAATADEERRRAPAYEEISIAGRRRAYKRIVVSAVGEVDPACGADDTGDAYC